MAPMAERQEASDRMQALPPSASSSVGYVDIPSARHLQADAAPLRSHAEMAAIRENQTHQRGLQNLTATSEATARSATDSIAMMSKRSADPYQQRVILSSQSLATDASQVRRKAHARPVDANGAGGLETGAPLPPPQRHLSDKPAMGIFSVPHIGLLVSLVFASVMTSCLKRGVLPMMRGDLGMEVYQVDAAEVLLMLPWSTMFVWGFISDCVPLFGSHRKSYMVLGWVLTATGLFAMAFLSYVQEYDDRLRNRDPTMSADQRAAVVNLYLLLLGVACFGGILSVIVAEIYIVAQSKREPVAVRGQVIGAFLMTQFLCECLGQAVTDYFLFQVTDFGINPQFPFRSVVLFFSCYALVPIVALVLGFHEDPEIGRDCSHVVDEFIALNKSPTGHHEGDKEDLMATPAVTTMAPTWTSWCCCCSRWCGRTSISVRAHLQLLWDTLSRLSTWHVMRFLAVYVFFSEFTLKYPHLVLDALCGVTTKVTSSGKIVYESVTFLAIYLWRVFCLNANWKWLAGISLLAVLWVPQVFYFNLVALDVGRRVDVYVIIVALRGFLRGMIIVLEVAMTVEIAPQGGEGATLGMIASMAAIMRLAATTGSNLMGFAFHTQEIQDDGLLGAAEAAGIDEAELRDDFGDLDLSTVGHRLQNGVVLALMISYLIKLVAMAGIAFLPTQKDHIMRLHYRGMPSHKYVYWTIGMLMFCVALSATVNTLVVTPTTSCMHALGGSGCVTMND